MGGLYVISGGPGTGKTSVINELEKLGFMVLPEAAREVGTKDAGFIGKSVKGLDAKQFQDAIFDMQVNQCSQIDGNKAVFADRSFGDTLAYYKINKIKISDDKLNHAKKFRVSKVFIMDLLGFYKTDSLRDESKARQERIHKEIIKTYKSLGYELIIVPFDTVKNRVKFILERIEN